MTKVEETKAMLKMGKMGKSRTPTVCERDQKGSVDDGEMRALALLEKTGWRERRAQLASCKCSGG